MGPGVFSLLNLSGHCPHWSRKVIDHHLWVSFWNWPEVLLEHHLELSLLNAGINELSVYWEDTEEGKGQ